MFPLRQTAVTAVSGSQRLLTQRVLAQCLLLSQGSSDAVVIHSLVMTNCGSIVTSATSVGTAIPLLRRNANYSVEDCYFGGNKMSFAGLPKVEDRANLVAWLATQQ